MCHDVHVVLGLLGRATVALWEDIKDDNITMSGLCIQSVVHDLVERH